MDAEEYRLLKQGLREVAHGRIHSRECVALRCHYDQLLTALRALEAEMREKCALTNPQAPAGGQQVGPRMYQQPTTHRFAKQEILPIANKLAALLTEPGG